MHLVPPKILYNHCDRFLTGRLLYPGEIGNNGYAKYWGVNMLNSLLENLPRKTLSYFSYFPLLCAEYKHLQHTGTAVADLFFF